MWAVPENVQVVLRAPSHPGYPQGLPKITQELPKTSLRDQFYIYKLPINRTADATGDNTIIFMFAYVHIYIETYISIYIYSYICVYIYMYIYRHTFI